MGYYVYHRSAITIKKGCWKKVDAIIKKLKDEDSYYSGSIKRYKDEVNIDSERYDDSLREIMDALYPHITDGSDVEMDGEGGEHWRFVKKGGKILEQERIDHYESCFKSFMKEWGEKMPKKLKRELEDWMMQEIVMEAL